MLQHSLSSGESSDEDAYIDEPEEEENRTFLCLFCEEVFKSAPELFEHSSTLHTIDIVDVLGKLSFYGIVKTINHTRANKSSVDAFTDICKTSEGLSDEFLKPFIVDDALLMVDFEEITQSKSVSCSKNENGVKHKDSDKTFLLEAKLKRVQEAYLELLEARNVPNAAVDSLNNDYFDSYADYSIHADMLQDKARTEAYRDYIYKNDELFLDKDVLDVGCGTGILSMFCAKAGAKSVTAVDNSKIVDKSKQIIKKNNLSSVIQIVEGKMEEVQLDTKFDVIISEWMGYALLFECMLDSVISARENHLKPGGLMVPNRASLFLSAVSNTSAYQKRFTFWENVYDFDMSDIIADLFKGAHVESVEEKHVVSTACGFKHLDLSTVKVPDLEFTSPFQLQINKSCSLTGFTVYFSCSFGGKFSVVLDTSPASKSTHWAQTVLYLESVMNVSEGDIIQGSVSFNKISADKRGYVIKLDGVCESGSFNQEFYIR